MPLVSTVALTVDDLYERLIRFLSQIFPHVNGLLLLVLVPLLTVTAAALIAAVTVLAVAFFVISGIGVVTIAIFEGAETGWNEGFAEVLNIIYNSFKSGQSIFSEEFAVPANRDQEPAIVIDLSTLEQRAATFQQIRQRLGERTYQTALMMLLEAEMENRGIRRNLAPMPDQLDVSNPDSVAAYLEQQRQHQSANHYQLILEQFREAGIIRNSQAMSEEHFANMELPQPDRQQLIDNCPAPLSPEEITRFENVEGEEINDYLTRHQDLRRLTTDKCAISLDRPQRGDAVLLVKQYQQNGVWQSVPQASHIFGKEDLKHWLSAENAVHPLTQDKIIQPAAFEVGKASYPTRYVYHNYYLDNSPHGFSQEVNLVVNYLREALAGLDLSINKNEPPASLAMGY